MDHFGRFRQVAKISLWIALVSICGLLFIALYIDTPNEGYLQSIHSLVTSKRDFTTLWLLTGLWLIAATAVITWIITLYSSFRVAGPLYRFSRNLDFGSGEEPPSFIRIRSSDYLQKECLLLGNTISSLYGHYGESRALFDALEIALLDEEEDKVQRLIGELTAQLERVKLDA